MSKKFVILPDVTCDLTDELRAEYDIGFINGHIKMADGEDMPSFLNWGDVKPQEFYKKLHDDPQSFSTSPPNVYECFDAFEKSITGGFDVLALTISSALSGTYDFMIKAVEMAREKYPEARIRCVDSRRFSAGCGLLAIRASILRSEGKDVDEVAEYLENDKNTIHQAGFLDDLSFVAKKGRLTHAKAFFGTLVGIKPIGEFDYNGLTTVIGKAKGEKQAFKVLIDYIGRTIIDAEEQVVLIATSDRDKQALIYKKLIEERFHPKKVYICPVFPSSAINVGTGLMAAYYSGKPISEGLSEEKQIITELLSAK